MKNVKRFIAYVLVLMLLIPLMVFPEHAYGRDNTIELFSLKTFNGKYLCAEDGGGSTLTADRDNIGEWEKFQIVDLGRGNVALKSYNGYYVSASTDEKNIYVDANEIGRRQTFELVRLDNNKVAFKSYYNNYICAEDGGGGKVVADRTEIGNWESFELIKSQESNPDKSTLTATPSDKSITFTWTKPRDTRNIAGYNLYRGTVSGKQSSTPVTDFPIEGTSYTDKNVKSGTTYYYVLKAVYKDKTLGPASNEVSVILKTRITLSGTTADKGVNLSWNKPSDSSNIIGYNLYRGTASGKQSSTPITDFPIVELSYNDKNVEDNKTYYYILRPVYKDKTLGEASNEVNVKSGLNGKTIVLEVGSKYMYVNGVKKEIDPGKGTIVIIKDGRTFLPIRAVIEAMGGEVEWNQADKRVSIFLKNNKIYLWIGNKIAKVNGVNKESDVAPYISSSDRTMLPLRFIVENLDCEVDWDGVTKKVTIKTKN